MSRYRRPRPAGGAVFFTVCLARAGGTLLIDHVDLLRAAVTVTRARRPFGIDAWVVLPDHMHAVWTLPEADPNYSERWGAIKARFTRDLRDRVGRASAPHAIAFPTEFPVVRSGEFAGLKPGLRQDKREQAIWQRRFWEHHIRDQRDYDAHVRYCWINPVKHGYVERPADWVLSSIHRDIRAGRVEAEFAGEAMDGRFGEMG